MQLRYHVTRNSSNSKTGPIAVTTSGRATCPPTCPFMDNCYPNAGKLRIHWDKVSRGERGDLFLGFLNKLRSLAPKSRVRGQQAGDMPGDGVRLNEQHCVLYVKAATSYDKAFFTYCHYPVEAGPGVTEEDAAHNRRVLLQLNAMPRAGVNVSCETKAQVDRVIAMGLPAVIVLPSKTGKPTPTPNGTRIVECPATRTARLFKAGRISSALVITCANCGGTKGALCMRSDRNFVVGFIAHAWTRKIDAILHALGAH